MFLKSCPWPRVCNKCGEAKLIDQFKLVHRGNGIYGRAPHCKACRPKDKNQKEYSRRTAKKIAALRKQRLQAEEFICLFCGRGFHKSHGNQKYCKDDECKKERKLFKEREWSQRQSHKIKEKIIYKNYRSDNLAKVRAYDRKVKRNKVENLYDCYIKYRLTANTILNTNDIPNSLICLKKEHLRIMRKLNKKGG